MKLRISSAIPIFINSSPTPITIKNINIINALTIHDTMETVILTLGLFGRHDKHNMIDEGIVKIGKMKNIRAKA